MMKRTALNLLGLAVSTIPVAVCILLYFPVWRDRGIVATLSGFTLLLLTLAAVPLFNLIKRTLKSPSAPIMWFAVFIVFLTLSSIAQEMTVVAFVGFVSNLVGALIFRLAEGGPHERT
jgi:Co/Zn/Cd efflux system component